MDTFDPVKYSKEENQFLLENVGKAPIVALNNALPNGVNPRAVRPVLQEVYDREELKKHEKVEWVGIEAVKEKINDFLTLDAKWEKDWVQSRGRVPRFPTLYSRDGKGKFHWAGPGSDSGHPKHYTKNGEVQTFELNLGGGVDEWAEGDVFALPTSSTPLALIFDAEKTRIECPICHHTESYKAESRSSYNAARARMSRHLSTAPDEKDLHAELRTLEFGS